MDTGPELSETIPNIAFVVRSNTLPTVRVGLYGSSEKRLWTSTGSIHVAAAPVSVGTTATVVEEDEDGEEDMVMVSHKTAIDGA
jgi:hypothetical protein